MSEAGAAAAVPELVCYPLEPDPPAIEPARAGRAWMDATDQRYAYRCLPLSMANASGWEILAPVAFEATWSGTRRPRRHRHPLARGPGARAAGSPARTSATGS